MALLVVLTETFIMRVQPWIPGLFWIAALYDFVIGAAFLVAPAAMFSRLGITPPNHWGYVNFAAGVVAIFGIAFAMVAANPVRHRNIIPLGMLLKVTYCATVFGHQLFGSIPSIWVWFAWADLAFLILFIAAWLTLPRSVPT